MKSTDTKPDLGLKVDAKTESRNAEMVKVKGKKNARGNQLVVNN